MYQNRQKKPYQIDVSKKDRTPYRVNVSKKGKKTGINQCIKGKQNTI